MSKMVEGNLPRPKDFKDLIESTAKRYKDKVAYQYKKDFTIENSEIIEKTFNEVGKDVKALSTSLLDRGFSKKRIAIIGNNRYEWVVSYFAIVSGAMIVAPMDKMLPEVEIESLVERSSVEAVICTKDYIDVFKKIKALDANVLDTIICMDDIEDKEVITFNELLNEGYEKLKKGNCKYKKVKIDTKAMSVMLFTSGTTDKSKIVMLSQNNILSNLVAYQNNFKILSTDKLLSILPIHHTFESSITILYGFYRGATVAFGDGLKYIAQNLKEYKITIFVAVPLLIETMYKKIQREIERQGKTKLVNTMVKISNTLLKLKIDIRKILFKSILDNLGGHLRVMLYGAAALDKDTAIGFRNYGLESIQGYGLTETSPILTTEKLDKHCDGSAGLPLDNVKIKILNPDKDGIGSIVVKAPNVFLGYYQNKEKTKEAFSNGWFITGDYGYINKDGFLFITGRKNDIIVLSNGKNVYPQEIETLINRLPYVKESMVFTKSKSDSVLTAKIVYDENEIKKRFPDIEKSQYEKSIYEDIEKINKNLVAYKNIKQIIVTSKEMAKTTTQKIKRYEEIKKILEEENLKTINKEIVPKNKTEEKILQHMQEVLDKYDLCVESDFFQSGGDSLSAIELQINLSKDNIELNTQEIYDNPTARKLSEYIIKNSDENANIEVKTVDIESKTIEIKQENNILLTGATGFLGIHILNELLSNTNNVYCLIRETNGNTPEEKLKSKYKYYFEKENLNEYLNKRLFIIKGELTRNNFGIEKDEYIKLANKVDIIINVAASVSHYANREESYKSNVVSTQNIVKFAIDSNALVNHISTIGIAGNHLVNTNSCIKDSFSENDLIIGQKYKENVYISTKLEAEKYILENINNNKINANILRVGNLMNRYKDNVFQDNKNTNAFQNKMREIINIRMAPKGISEFSFDLTPVDLCAEAVVKLSFSQKYNNVYHVLNSYEVSFKDIIEKLKLYNIDINIIDEKDIVMDKVSNKWLINDLIIQNKRKIMIDSTKTQEELKKLGFEWQINPQYYLDVLKSIIED